VVGASRNRRKLGWQILDNIFKGGFKGAVFPINLRARRVAGRPAFSDLAALPLKRRERERLLVVFAIPAPLLLREVEKCAVLGIKNLIIISAGFKEVGGRGRKREEALVQLARKHQLNILGPNCLGLINTFNALNATFAAADKKTGAIAFLSQSGAIGAAVLDWLKTKNFSLGYFISLGNKAVLDENDVLVYLARDRRVELIVAYLEEIKDGQKFMALVSRLSKHKPVAVLQAGQSAAGGQLARSHTGALTSSLAAVKAGLKRAGAIWLENLEELFNLLSLFRKEFWRNRGREDLYLITNAGGSGVLTVDEISRQNLKLGRSWDILGDADAQRYRKALRKLLADKKVNNLLVLLTPQTMSEPLLTARFIAAAAKKYPHKLIMASFLGGKAVASARAYLEKQQVPVFDFSEEAVATFKKLLTYKHSALNLSPYRPPAVRIKKPVRADDYLRALALLKKYCLRTVKSFRYKAQPRLSFKRPLVLKLVGPDFNHKSEQGAVVVGLKTRAQLRSAVKTLSLKNKSLLADGRNYFLIQPQVNKAQELILGFKRDPAFGPLLLIGRGGIYTEIFNDVAWEIADLDYQRALKLIASLKIYPILNGARGQKKYAIAAAAHALVNLARLANEHPEIKELDINPLFLTRDSALAADIRLVLS